MLLHQREPPLRRPPLLHKLLLPSLHALLPGPLCKLHGLALLHGVGLELLDPHCKLRCLLLRFGGALTLLLALPPLRLQLPSQRDDHSPGVLEVSLRALKICLRAAALTSEDGFLLGCQLELPLVVPDLGLVRFSIDVCVVMEALDHLVALLHLRPHPLHVPRVIPAGLLHRRPALLLRAEQPEPLRVELPEFVGAAQRGDEALDPLLQEGTELPAGCLVVWGLAKNRRP
mmetsp:Transcript_38958/g.116411  ORF Transcript_38958/g.116411 Transcript_38958/m.116411 type:complete len:230 (+) Transcript_38958:654-1343(+)